MDAEVHRTLVNSQETGVTSRVSMSEIGSSKARRAVWVSYGWKADDLGGRWTTRTIRYT